MLNFQFQIKAFLNYSSYIILLLFCLLRQTSLDLLLLKILEWFIHKNVQSFGNSLVRLLCCSGVVLLRLVSHTCWWLSSQIWPYWADDIECFVRSAALSYIWQELVANDHAMIGVIYAGVIMPISTIWISHSLLINHGTKGKHATLSCSIGLGI